IKETIEDLQQIQNEKMLRDLKEKVLISLIKSYPVLDKELKAIKTYINEADSSEGKQIENYQIMLSFLYKERDKKSDYVKEIYKGFYKHCQKHISISNSQKEIHEFNSLIQLMKLITEAHLDSLYLNANNVDNARFQLILLHILFEENNILKNINELFIDFLSWLFQTLPTYGSTEKIEDINIEMKHIERLKKLSLNVKELCTNESNQNIHHYKYLYISISTIYEEMKLIYLQKLIKILSKKYSDAKWLEIIIYFPEYFQTNVDDIFDLIPKEEK
ncbi:unnamed protein product, partial [Didymodactylos carnosus]